MKIRIFTLAKELDIDSKVLIDACHKVGIILKNSALASITPEEKDKVLAVMKQGGTQEASAPETMTPQREAPRHVTTKVPEIKATPPVRTPLGDKLRRHAREAAPVEEATPVAPQALVEEAVPAPEAPVPEPETETETETATPADVVDQPPAVAAEAAPEIPEVEEKAADAPAVHRREDYVSAYGTRQMVSRGTSDLLNRGRPGPVGGGQTATTPLRPKGRPGPSLPKLAEMPPQKAPPAPVAEGPAQKPEIRLPREGVAEGKPLQEMMKKHAEDRIKLKAKKGGVPGTEVEETPDEAGVAGKRGTAGKDLLSARKERQGRRTPRVVLDDEDEGGVATSARHKRASRRHVPVSTVRTTAEIELPLNLRSLSEALGRRAQELVGILMRKGVMVTINSPVEEETAIELAMECGLDLHIKRPRNVEDELEQQLQTPADQEKAVLRPPIVTILGHVDHGKTTLLDKIRSANVAAGEAGGITQHIAAYQVQHNGQPITFLDTPGHAAFGEMRARGANVTDIAILVVAANDGVMPQTVEAISHIKAAGVPIIVALNKIDIPDRDENRVLQELATHNVLVAEWGGDTEVVRTSGLTGAGLDDLLETILTIAELREFKADPERAAFGVCLEAFRDEGRGPLAWLIVQQGTLRKGDMMLCGEAFGRIRNIYDDQNREIDEATPSMPVKVAGLDIVPGAGDRFFVMEDQEQARQLADTRREKGRQATLSQRGKPRTLEDLVNEAKTGAIRDLPLIVKADTPGSLEALKGEILKFQHPEVRVNILHDGVGGVNESDVSLATASEAIIVAFHVVPEDRAQAMADREGVEIRQYRIIYEVTGDIKNALEGLLRPEQKEVVTGRALVLQVFEISRFGKIAGCRVLNGTIARGNRIRVIRDQRVLNDYNIQSLKRNKDDSREVREGLECGIRLDGFDDVKEGDIFQAYRIDEVKRTLE